MPKMKSNRSAGKRFRVTKRGKVMFTKAGLRHNLGDMRGKDQRHKAKPAVLADEHRDDVLRLLGRK